MSEVFTGIVGGVVGFFVGGPSGAVYGAQLGYAAGSALFAEESVIQGQKVGELAAQTSREGVPRPIVFGTARPIGGNVIATTGPIIRINRERVGSGKSKQTVESEEIYRTYAIRICEGPVAGVRRVWRNGTLVYFAGSDDETQIQNNQEFLKIATFYLGDFEQEPDPNLQAIFGVDNVVAHRGTCYMVVYDENLTQLGGAIPQYQFEVGQAKGQYFPQDTYFWLDGADPSTIIASSGRVSEWHDKSGNDRHFEQGNASSRPHDAGDGVRFENPRTISTEPGITEYMQLVEADSLDEDTVFTIFCIVDESGHDSDALNDRGCVISNTGTLNAENGTYNDCLIYLNRAATRARYNFGPTRLAEVSPDWSDGRSNLINARWTTAQRSCEANASGSIVTNVAPLGGVVHPRDVFLLGIQRIPSEIFSALSLRATIREVVAYSRTLGAEEKADVETYLMSKWGIN